MTRLAIGYNYIGDQARATLILDTILPTVEGENAAELYGKIYYAYAVIHIKFDEFSTARGFVKKSLDHYRESGDWAGIAAAYQLLGKIYNREGAGVKAIESWKLAIDMIGKRSAPYLLGKIYGDMAGAYWLYGSLRKASNVWKNQSHFLKVPNTFSIRSSLITISV